MEINLKNKCLELVDVTYAPYTIKVVPKKNNSSTKKGKTKPSQPRESNKSE